MIKFRKVADNGGRKVSLFSSNPGLYYAYEIHESAPPLKRAIVQSRLLAGEDDVTIAKMVGTIPEAIQYYEAIFYNVRDRLEAQDWIISTVIVPGYLRSGVGEDETLMMYRFFGYFGGPMLLNFLLTGFKPGIAKPSSPEDLDFYLDKHVQSGIRRRSAVSVDTFEVNKYNVMELFSTHCRLVEIEKSTESLEEAKSGLEANILAMMRQMPWSLSREPHETFKDSRLLEYEEASMELTDEEQMLVAAGMETDEIRSLMTFKLPPPEERDRDNASDDQQGSRREDS